MKPSFTKLLLLFLLPILIYFHLHGLANNDEGYILNSAQKVIDGQAVYRDFHFRYTPLSIFFTSSALVLLGNSILSSRILMILIDLFSIFLIIQICKSITRKNIYAFFASLVYVIWGPAHINFAAPVMFAIPLTLLSIYLVKLFEKSQNPRLPFLIGLNVFAVFLADQKFGILFLPILFYFLVTKKRISQIFNFIYGTLWGIIFFSLYLLSTSSFESFINDFYNFSLKNLFIGRLGLSSFFYIILPASSIALIILLIYRKKYGLIFIPLLTLLYSIAGLSSQSDYSNLVPLISLTGTIIVIFINKLPLLYIKVIGYFILVMLLISGFQTALFEGGSNASFYSNNFVSDKISVFTNDKFADDYKTLKNYVNLYTKKDDYIYVDSYSPIIYYVLERKQPTKNDFPVYPNSSSYQKEVVYSLVGKEVKAVLLSDSKSSTQTETYVHSKYRFIKRIGDYFLFVLP